MILVDTSAWVDYLRKRGTPVAAHLKQLIEAEAELVTTEPVIMELLAGGNTPPRAAALERLTNGLPLLAMDSRLDYRAAARLYATTRSSGRTVRSLIDCLIAAVAIRRGVPLLHKDADYDVIAEIAPLQVELF